MSFLSFEEKSRAMYLYKKLAYGHISDPELYELELYVRKAVQDYLWYRSKVYMDEMFDICSAMDRENGLQQLMEDGICSDPKDCLIKARDSCKFYDKAMSEKDIVERYKIFRQFSTNILGHDIGDEDLRLLRSDECFRHSKTRRETVICIDNAIQTVHSDTTLCEVIFDPEFCDELQNLRHEENWW